MTTADILRDALIEIAVQDPIDPVDPNQQSLALSRYNQILDQWNAQQIATYAVLFPTFTTTLGLSPHTIGVAVNTPTWTVTGNRPVAILGANQQISSGVNLINVGPLNLRDRDWWQAQSSPGVQSGVPTDLYYEPTWPNGSLYFWPVPNAAYVVQLEARYVLDVVTEADLGSTVTWPPGYQRALTLTLAEDLTVPLTVPMPPKLERLAEEARSVIFGNNNAPVRIATRQSGMPGGATASGGGFNWRTGRGGGR